MTVTFLRGKQLEDNILRGGFNTTSTSFTLGELTESLTTDELEAYINRLNVEIELRKLRTKIAMYDRDKKRGDK